MNPLFRIHFKQGIPPIDKIVDELRRRSGLAVHVSDKKIRHTDVPDELHDFLIAKELVREYHEITFASVNYLIDFEPRIQTIVFKHRRHWRTQSIPYFESLLIHTLISLGGEGNPDDVHLSSFVNMPYHEASKMKGFR